MALVGVISTETLQAVLSHSEKANSIAAAKDTRRPPCQQPKTGRTQTGRKAEAQAVLDAQAEYLTSSLADLDDLLTIPAALLNAHQDLDRAVDRCYRPEPFPSDRHRVEYLFALYEQLTAPLVAAAKPARKGRKPQTAS